MAGKQKAVNESKELRRTRRHYKLARNLSVLSVIGSAAFGLLIYPKMLADQVNRDLYGNPDNIKALQDLYVSYGCANKQEWEQLIAEHTTMITKNVFEGGVLVKKTVGYGDAVAVEMTSKYSELCSAISNSPVDYITPNYGVVAITIAIPTVLILTYLILRHRYKKMLKAGMSVASESPSS